jgi:transcriptional regulator with XRE-family HTH domain
MRAMSNFLTSNFWTGENGRMALTGPELVEWRRRNGFSQADLMAELDIASRQTISSWERAPEVPRMVELAVIALEVHPDCRRRAGRKASAEEKRAFRG